MSNTYVLQDWAIVRTEFNPYQAPEAYNYVLQGKVYGNPKFTDGTEIKTSTIIKAVDDETYLTASGSLVKVGKKDPSYQLYLDNYNSQV